MKRFGHDQISTFGIGREFEKKEWQSIFRQLVALNLLAVDNTEYGGMKITLQGQAFLKHKETLRLRKWSRPAKIKSGSLSRAPLTFDSEDDEKLFNALRVARLELAREQNVPPYVIFHDKTLREIALQKPVSRPAFSVISGVGQSKLERYGDAFLEVIRSHLGR